MQRYVRHGIAAGKPLLHSDAHRLAGTCQRALKGNQRTVVVAVVLRHGVGHTALALLDPGVGVKRDAGFRYLHPACEVLRHIEGHF